MSSSLLHLFQNSHLGSCIYYRLALKPVDSTVSTLESAPLQLLILVLNQVVLIFPFNCDAHSLPVLGGLHDRECGVRKHPADPRDMDGTDLPARSPSP